MTTSTVPARRPSVAGEGELAAASRDVDDFLQALNPTVMGPRLSGALGVGRRSCHVLDAKYEPGVKAIVLYRFGDDLVRADLCACGVDADRATRRPRLRLSVFPADPDLPTLESAVDPTSLGRLLAGVLPGPSNARERRAWAGRCEVELLRYRPGKRATVRASSPLRAVTYVVKVYHDVGKATSVAREARLLNQACRSAAVLRVAPHVAYLSELNAVVQQSVPGVPLADLLSWRDAGGERVREAVQRAALSLAELHDLPVVSTRERSVNKELRRFIQRGEAVRTVDPCLGAALLQLARRLSTVDAELEPGPVGLVHGDCKPSQFLVSDDGIFLLDLDHCGVTQQATDIGTFLASLRQLGIRHGLAGRKSARRPDLGTVANDFVSTYLIRRGTPALRSRIRWHEAAALQRKALRAFFRSPRSPLPAALLHEGHACLDDLGRGST
jgi:aminoglycoside phosphotransferase (APT) family kinase protein